MKKTNILVLVTLIITMLLSNAAFAQTISLKSLDERKANTTYVDATDETIIQYANTHAGLKTAHGLPAYAGNADKYIRLNTEENMLYFADVPEALSSVYRDVIYVNSTTTVPTGDQTGAAERPFATIQQALDHIGPATNAATYQQSKLILITNSGTYTENLTAQHRAITIAGRGVTISGDVLRYVADEEEFGVSSSTFRAALTFLGYADTRDSHQRIRQGITITGNYRAMVKPTFTGSTTHDAAFINTRINGAVTIDDGVVNSGAPSVGQEIFYCIGARFAGTVEGRTIYAQRWSDTQFDSTIIIGTLCNLNEVEFKGAVTMTQFVADLGLFNTKFATMNLTIPAGQSVTMDGVTATSWKANVTPSNAVTINYMEHDKGVKNNSSITGATVFDALTSIYNDYATKLELAAKADSTEVWAALDNKAEKTLSNVDPATGRSALGLGTAATKDSGTTEGTIPLLDAAGQIPFSMIPALVFNNSHVVTSEVDMLSIPDVKTGEIAIRTDITKNYILSAMPGTELSNWLEFAATEGSVKSVSGSAPITSTGGDNPAIGITAATQDAAGSMSAVDKTKLDNATTENTINTIVMRDDSGKINADLTGTASTASVALTAIQADKLTTARTIDGVSFDGTANINTKYTGTGTFNSINGRTITIGATMPDTNYKVFITNTSVSDGSLGDVEVRQTSKSTTQFTVYNTGENNDGTFEWIVVTY